MSFSMIFSIILIAFFVFAAFFGIRAFLKWQDQANYALFFRDLQADIDNIWNCDNLGKCEINFSSNIKTDADYLCFADLIKAPSNSSILEMNIREDIKKSTYKTAENLYFYSSKEKEVIRAAIFKHIDFETENPYCFKIINKKVSFKIIKSSNGLVKLA